jgi:hypothetical protein
MAVSSPAFERLSSDFGSSGSPFDKAMGNRDKIVAGFIKKINRLNVQLVPGQTVLLSDSWGDEIISTVQSTFPGMGGFGPGGGPLS